MKREASGEVETKDNEESRGWKQIRGWRQIRSGKFCEVKNGIFSWSSKMNGSIMVKFRHGGQLIFGAGGSVEYVGGTFDVEFIEENAFSIPFLMNCVEKYGYCNVLFLYYSLPGMGGLRKLISHSELLVMLKEAQKHKVVEIFADHHLSIPSEVDIPLEGVSESPSSEIRNISHRTPTKYKKVVSKKKLTPRRNMSIRSNCQITTQSPSAPHVKPISNMSTSSNYQTSTQFPSAPHVKPISEANESSSESDDEADDETYKIDLTEGLEDDNFDELGLFDEFRGQVNVNRKGKAHEKIPEDNAEVNVTSNVNVTETIDAENNAPTTGDGYESEKSVESNDSQARDALNSDNDELYEYRQRNQRLLSAKMGKITFDAGAKLTTDGGGELRGAVHHRANIFRFNAPNVDPSPSESIQPPIEPTEGVDPMHETEPIAPTPDTEEGWNIGGQVQEELLHRGINGQELGLHLREDISLIKGAVMMRMP